MSLGYYGKTDRQLLADIDQQLKTVNSNLAAIGNTLEKILEAVSGTAPKAAVLKFTLGSPVGKG